MTDFKYIRGSDVTVLVDGKVQGGIIKLVCKEKRDYIPIEEFLTDLPVYRYCVKSYVITFHMNCSEDNIYYFDNVESIKLVFPNGTEEYSGCRVHSIENAVPAKGNIEYEVTVLAETRVSK